VTLDIVFQGMDAPLRLHGAKDVLALLPKVVAGWPFDCRVAGPGAVPFFSIRSVPDDPLLLCQSHVEAKPARRLDPLNALCDAMAALGLALPAEDDRLICLHAAGVAMAGRLVVFPSVRRAGKSTLSVALARGGHALFGDDVLPLSFSVENHVRGHAMGIAPRVRLPLPDTLPGDFREWVDKVDGPRNRQYKYLALAGQPLQGMSLPVGAFVILDRQDDPVSAHLAPVTPDIAMDALLHQNFTRDRHSADILRAIAAALSSRPVFRLAYADLSDAVACLEAAFARWPDGDPPDAAGPAQRFRSADFTGGRRARPMPDSAVGQRRGTLVRAIGDRLYLADAEGRAIHRLDPLATVIWEVLEDATTARELEEMLAAAFPDTGRDRIAADLRRILERFAEAGLIEAYPAD